MNTTVVVGNRFHVDGDDAVCFYASRFETWNGWAVPFVDRANALAAIARVNELDDEREISITERSGDVLELAERYRHDGQVLAVTRLEPSEGIYRLAMGMTFVAVDEAAEAV